MNVPEQVALGWQCLRFCLGRLLSPALWAPWLVIGAVELLVIAALWWFAHPGLSWAMAPLLTAAAGPESLRYPNIFRLMPSLFARADLIIQASLGALAAGASTALFASHATDAPIRPATAWRQAVGRGLPLILVNLPLTLLALGISTGLGAWLAARGSSGMVRRVAEVGSLGAIVVLQAWFLYANALVVLGRRDWRSALGTLPRMAPRGMAAGLLISLVALAPVFGVQTITAAAASLVDRGVPELVGWLVVAQMCTALVSAFLLTGSAAVFYQSALVETAEGEWR